MAATPSPLLLGYPWTTQKVKGWWLSEKYDGVRGYWTGSELLSREGRPIKAPAWFTSALPVGLPLDGELWAGRGLFGVALGAVKSERHSAWRQMRFAAFDLPGHGGIFEERQHVLNGLGLPPVCFVIEQQLCQGMHHLKRALQEVADMHGEGLMLRAPGSRYEVGRSHSLLKVRIANNTELLRPRRLAA